MTLGRTFKTSLLATMAASLLVAASANADAGSGGSEASVAPVATAPANNSKPTTSAPTTEAKPTTSAPTTEAKPTTSTPTTETKPTTSVPTTVVPVTESPVTETPVTEAPVTKIPVTDTPKTPDQPEAPKTCADTPNAATCIPETPSRTPEVPGDGTTQLPFTGPGDVIMTIVIALLAGTGGLLFMFGAAGREQIEGLNRRTMNSPSGFKLAYRELLKQQIDE